MTPLDSSHLEVFLGFFLEIFYFFEFKFEFWIWAGLVPTQTRTGPDRFDRLPVKPNLFPPVWWTLPPARGGRPTNDRHCCPGAQQGRAHRATNNRRRSSPRPRAPSHCQARRAPDRRPSISVAETSARLAPYLFRRGRPGAVPRLRSLGLPPGACRGVTRCAAPRAWRCRRMAAAAAHKLAYP